MMKFKNETNVEGYLYEHNLKSKVSGDDSKHPGTTFISGDVSIATDEECTNIVKVHYIYVTPTFGNGKKNSNFTILNDIIDGKYNTVMANGKENAAKIRIPSAIGLNDFYVDRDGEVQLVSAKRNEGGFINIVNNLNDDENRRNLFKCDMLITGARRIEADEEKDLPEKMILKGAVFNYRNALLPVEFTVLNPNAMDYFESLEVSNSHPVLTQVRGHQISEVVVKTYSEESAFDTVDVHEVPRSHKEFVVTWAAKEPYDWDTEDTLTGQDLKEKIAERETYLAGVRQRYDQYQASKGNASSAAAEPANGAFNF